MREDFFREYCKILKDEKRRAKEKEREHKREKEKHGKSKRDKDKEGKSSKNQVAKDDTMTVDADMSDIEEPAALEKNAGDQDVTPNNDTDDERAKEERDKEKQARAEASLREREKEVQRTLATHLRDRDKEREQHKRDEAIQVSYFFSINLFSSVRSLKKN